MPNASSQDRSSLSAIAATVAIGMFLIAAVLVVAISTTGGGSGGSVATNAPVAVTLSEFKITPNPITAGTGKVTLAITNSGSQVHNLSVPDLGKKSADIPAGGTGTLDLGTVAAGTYAVLCEIPGHADSGMKATLVVTEGGAASSTDAAAAGAHSQHATTPEEWKQVDARMKAGMEAGLKTFTGGNATKGVGNVPLEPTVLPDGTKEFKLTSAITDWEVSPGKTVKAWTYNGMVPGPWIKVNPNDKVKVTIKNDLPIATDIHFHGITTPFDQDGVAPLTQPYINSGETFSYEFQVPNEAQLGMYHAHFNGEEAVVNGMFAVFQVGDMPLPRGRTISGKTIPANLTVTQEIPMVLNDAGVIGLSLNGKSYPATAPYSAKPGDALLIDYFNEGLLTHPMHLHHVFTLVVAKDGVPLDYPYWADTINVAPGERYQVLALPTTADLGVWAWHCHILNHAENADGLFGMVTALIVEDPNKAK